jgi:hypothetical protein
MNLIQQKENTEEEDYWKQHEYYRSLHNEKFKKLKKDENKYYDIYLHGIKYYSDKLDKEVYGSENFYQIKEKMDHLYNKHYALQKPNQILKYEVDILWEISCYYLDKFNKVMKYDPKTKDFEELYFTKKNTPLKKKITKTKKKQLESEVCSICLDTHTYKNVIQLNCSHVFGKVCFQKLLQRSEEKGCDSKCPLCRTASTKYSLFKVK